MRRASVALCLVLSACCLTPTLDVEQVDGGLPDAAGAAPLCDAGVAGGTLEQYLSQAAIAGGDPFNGTQISVGGSCGPSSLIVTAVGSDFFIVADLSAYNPDSGLPNPGYDSRTGENDLPGSWGSLYVYTYEAPPYFLGARLGSITGTLQAFAGGEQLNFPAVSGVEEPQPQLLPNPVPIDPSWCIPRALADLPSDGLLCDDSVDDLTLPSLESSLIKIPTATLPSRWLDCNFENNGDIDYRTSAGCMPSTMGQFCQIDGGTACGSGEDCIANECVAQCQSTADCNLGDDEQCVDGHCQNACLCRQYCDSLPGCSELYEFNTYGQYVVTFPGSDGGAWKFGALTRQGNPNFDPSTVPGMNVRFLNGFLTRVEDFDPQWLIVTRIATDLCCVTDDPGCTTSGLELCGEY
jgi:hypothetical protein